MEASNISSQVQRDNNQLAIGGDDAYDIETVDHGKRFQLKFHVLPKFYGGIIGPRDRTRKRMERETHTTIFVPWKGSRDTNITIEGVSKENIIAAKKIIDSLVTRPQFTHILLVSFANEEIISSFLRFKDDVLKDSEASGVDLSLMFQKPENLALTITIMALPHNEDIVIGLECLEECKKLIVDKFLQDGPLQVTMAGLSSRNANLKLCTVLYANVISEKMQELGSEIKQHFAKRGLIKLYQENIKLQVSLMNAKFSAESGENCKSSHNLNWKPRGNFDATRILENFGDFHFGSFTVNEIHLSKLSNDNYESTGVIYFEGKIFDKSNPACKFQLEFITIVCFILLCTHLYLCFD